MTQSNLQKSVDAHELVQKLISLQNTSRELDIMKGRTLWELKADNTYKKSFGEGGDDSWAAFLKNPEIGLTVSEANRAMQLYEYFILKYEFSETDLAHIPVKSLNYMLPRLKSGEIGKENIGELVEAARNLTFADFRDTFYDVTDSGVRTYQFLIMKKCNETGNLSKVHNIASDRISAAFPEVYE